MHLLTFLAWILVAVAIGCAAGFAIFYSLCWLWEWLRAPPEPSDFGGEDL